MLQSAWPRASQLRHLTEYTLIQKPLDAQFLTTPSIKKNIKVSDKRYGNDLPFVHVVF
jgi:hypothetical protein